MDNGSNVPLTGASASRRFNALLEPGERVKGVFEPDLDSDLRFGTDLVVLTDRRLVAVASNSAGAPVRTWPIQDVHEAAVFERGALGSLEVSIRGESPLAWHFTVAKLLAARAFAEAVRRVVAPSESAPPIDSQVFEAPPDEDVLLADGEIARPAASLWRLSEFARKRIGLIALGFALTLASTAASLVPTYLTIPIFDNILIPHETGEAVSRGAVVWYLAALACAALVAWGLSWAKTYVLSWVSERIAADLRNRTYSHLQKLSLEFFGGKRTGDLMARVGSDTDRICNFLSLNLLDFASDTLMILMTAAVLISIHPTLAIVTLAPFPIIAWLVHIVRGKLRRGFADSGRIWGEMASVLADTIPGIRVVKAFAQEKREIERFHEANDRVLTVNDRVNRVWSLFGPTITLLTEFGLLVVWAYGVWLVFQGSITVGVLQAFLQYIARFYARLDSMSRVVAGMQRAAAATQRIFEILDQAPSVADPPKPVPIGRARGKLEFRDVGFRYGTRQILDDINLVVEPGEMIGLVGPSGAGKSTLVNLACRFYDVSNGAVVVDDHDVRSFAVEEYRRQIGLVLQEPFLFYGTVAENIAYGRPDASRAEIIRAARAARAHEFILRLAEGYDSIVGERGQKLSGGERQRISIARALLIDPPILILDEATSSVDTETELEIQEALDNLIRGRTTIAIAHRLSTLRRANRLVVLEQGRIAEVGQHHELLQHPNGAYSRLHHAQAELAHGTS